MRYILIAVLILGLMAPVFGAAPVNIKETQLLTYYSSAWHRLTAGDLASYAGAKSAIAVGGGFGDTGMSVDSAGNCYTDGIFKAGGGYTSTGVTISAAGVTQIAGTLTVDGASTLTGATTQTGLLTANGGIVCDTNKFAVADTTGIITLGGGGTIDNNTGATIMLLTEDTVRTSAALDVVTAATIGGGSGGSGSTLSADGTAAFDGRITATGGITAVAASTIPIQTVVAETTNTRVSTSADCGKLIVCTVADALAVTLPANNTTAGSYIDFLITVENGGTATFSSTPADTLYTANSIDSDAVTFASGHRIGAYVRFIATGANWVAINLGQTTMGVTDTD